MTKNNEAEEFDCDTKELEGISNMDVAYAHLSDAAHYAKLLAEDLGGEFSDAQLVNLLMLVLRYEAIEELRNVGTDLGLSALDEGLKRIVN